MGELKPVEKLEAYINEFGQEIKSVKKASVFLNEIEQQHILVEQQLDRVKETANILSGLQKQFEEQEKSFTEQFNVNENRLKEINLKVENNFSETEQSLKENLGQFLSVTALIHQEIKILESKLALLEERQNTTTSNVQILHQSVEGNSNKLELLQKQHAAFEKQQNKLMSDMNGLYEQQKKSSKKLEYIIYSFMGIVLVALVILKFI